MRDLITAVALAACWGTVIDVWRVGAVVNSIQTRRERICVLFTIKIPVEERLLTTKFEYASFRRRVPQLVPGHAADVERVRP